MPSVLLMGGTGLWQESSGDIQLITDLAAGKSLLLKEAAATFLTLNRSGSTYTTDDTTGTAWHIDLSTKTSGHGFLITTDSDNLTGNAFAILGGAGKAQNWLQVIKNTSDTEGCQLIVDGSNTVGAAAKPSLRIGNDEAGFYKTAANIIGIANNGIAAWTIGQTTIEAVATNGAGIKNGAGTATTPAFFNRSDTNTGIGWAAADALSAITGAIEGTRWTEASSAVIQASQANVGLTADAGSAQGGTPLTSSYNVISTCATAGDSVTLPATFPVGTIVKIKNDGAQSADVFPASGDDLGAGANTATALAAGSSITYIATVADGTWTSIGN